MEVKWWWISVEPEHSNADHCCQNYIPVPYQLERDCKQVCKQVPEEGILMMEVDNLAMATRFHLEQEVVLEPEWCSVVL